jgi:hypothetical protein
VWSYSSTPTKPPSVQSAVKFAPSHERHSVYLYASTRIVKPMKRKAVRSVMRQSLFRQKRLAFVTLAGGQRG